MVVKLKLVIGDTLEIFEFDTKDDAETYNDTRLDKDSIYSVITEE